METNAIAEHMGVKVNSFALLSAETWMCVFGVEEEGWGRILNAKIHGIDDTGNI